ncbi:MAG: hypothetical protein ACI8ZN_001289 [Bacteroidia bacterium]|jgi:uncharacterized protein YprB with RNaseH-like and TPR domain
MLSHIKLQNVLLLDIETVPAAKHFEDLDERWQKLWAHKAQFIAKNGESPSEIYQRAGIYAEFGKIVCISVGIFIPNGEHFSFKTKSYANHDERILLIEFCDLLSTKFTGNNKVLCAHNGKEFDFPYIARRVLVNGLFLPDHLDIAGKKPWEINHLDSMELWKFGDYKNFTSLDLLAAIFDIPTPKDDIDGSMVAKVYYEDNNLPRIARYCEKDVITLANLLLRYKGKKVLSDENIQHSED